MNPMGVLVSPNGDRDRAGAIESTGLTRTLPLLPEAPGEAVLACRGGKAVTRATFLRHVNAVAARLPQVERAVNLCGDRYWFAVSFFASVSRGIVNVFPTSEAPEHLTALRDESPGLVRLMDHDRPMGASMPMCRVDEWAVAGMAQASESMPLIAHDQCVARLYTSGSTGKPQGFDKHFGCLWQGVQAAARRVWPLMGGAGAVVGTSSFRHMFGFETTVLLPLWTGGCLSDAVPFFPADVTATLAGMPGRRLLVTTPYHLRKLLETDLAFPQVGAILCATAPLSIELARHAEERLKAPLLEIYGATELGMTATRRPCHAPEWSTLDGITLTRHGLDGDCVEARGPSLRQPQMLHDIIELLSPTAFRLIDRSANLVNIVGKRSSLTFLNHVLNGIPGVRDGLFCLPESAVANDAARLAAFVVAPALSAPEILAALRQQVDPVFLPRPLVFVDRIERDVNGKVSAATILALIRQHMSA